MMFESAITLNEFNRSYLSKLISDFAERELDLVPQPGLHSARWLLAHLAIAGDYGLLQFGLPMACEAEWHQAYGPGSNGVTSTSVCPSKQELMSKVEAVYARLCEAAKLGLFDDLSVPHTVSLLAGTRLRSKADIVSHILATHFALHLGQLSSLRRLTGRAYLF